MNEDDCIKFFEYDNSFRIDSLARANSRHDDPILQVKYKQAKIIYNDLKHNVKESFRKNEVSYALAAEVVGIAFKKSLE